MGNNYLGVWGSHKGAEGVFTMDLGFYIIHPGRLTWNLQSTHLERKMIFQTSMIMFHVNLPGCIHTKWKNGCFERWCSFGPKESEFCLGFHVNLVVVSNIFLCSTQPGEMIHVDLCFSKSFTPPTTPRKTNIDTKNSGMEDVSPFKHGHFPKKSTDDQGFFVDSIPFQSPSTWPPGMNSHNHFDSWRFLWLFFFGGGAISYHSAKQTFRDIEESRAFLVRKM